mgnify:FL=1
MEETQLTWRTTAIDRETPNDFAFAIRFASVSEAEVEVFRAGLFEEGDQRTEGEASEDARTYQGLDQQKLCAREGKVAENQAVPFRVFGQVSCPNNYEENPDNYEENFACNENFETSRFASAGEVRGIV